MTSAATTAAEIGQDVGLAQNKAGKIGADYSLANACFQALQTETSNRVAKANTLSGLIATTRTWCFRAKDTLKPFLGESHNVLYRPTGFVSSLRVPEDYESLLLLTDTLEKYFDKHPDQTNPPRRSMRRRSGRRNCTTVLRRPISPWKTTTL